MLRDAAVWSVDLRESPISTVQIKTTFGDGTTRPPNTIPRPTHWPKEELDWPDFQTEYQKWCADPDTYTPPDPEPSEGQAVTDKEPPASPGPSPAR